MIKINLLPRERARRPLVSARLGVAAGLIVASGFAIVSWIYLSGLNAKVRADIRDVDRQIEELRPQVARVEELKRQIEAARRKEQVLRQLESMRVAWDSVLDELRDVMPTDVWLIRIEARDDGSFSFNGFGMSYEAVARFMVSLEKSPRFRGVDLTLVQQQTLLGRDVVNFSLTAALAPVEKEARAP